MQPDVLDLIRSDIESAPKRFIAPLVSTCLRYAVDIQRNTVPAEWPKRLNKIPAECRQECEVYLRDIATRMRAGRAAKRRLQQPAAK